MLTTHRAWVAVGFVCPYTCQEHCASGHRDPLLPLSQGGTPARPDREIFREKCSQLSSAFNTNSPLGLPTFTRPVLVALLTIFEQESVVRQLGEGGASGNSKILCVYNVFIICLLYVYKLHQYNAQF